MTGFRQIRSIFRKELIDILRDRRTLMAMVLIPVVLYPMLMLGFLWAAQSQEAQLRTAAFVVEVPDEATAQSLRRLQAAVAFSQTNADAASSEASAGPSFVIQVGHTARSALGDAVELRARLETTDLPAPLPPQLEVQVEYNEISVESRAALKAFQQMMNRLGQALSEQSLRALLLQHAPELPADLDPDLVFEPIRIEAESVASEQQRGGWALGQIIPLILVLMTVTGAVYPAIDLTAGERERGTLETLMVLPVPTLHLIVGKFLVVATIAMVTALLNLTSVGATMHFGGLVQTLTAQMPVRFPLGVLPVILLCMVPFALFFAAVLVTVCSFARTFKEAQNYVMPVILASMLPCITASLPGAELTGTMRVVPVGNMVLLTRALFEQTATVTDTAIVLLSTSLYAAAAIGLAARLFGQEAVLFTDAGSYRTLLMRRFYRPRTLPNATEVLLLAAVMFPLSFYVQGAVFGSSTENFLPKLTRVAVLQFGVLFTVVPIVLAWYLKLDVRSALRIGPPAGLAWPAALCLGLSTWALAHELILLQPRSEALIEMARLLQPAIDAAPLALVLMLLAVAPACSEELFFRGLLLGGLSSRFRRWSAILAAAVIFGVYHFMAERLPMTILLGAVLGYLCWQAGSIWPGILVHLLHNSWPVLLSRFPDYALQLGMVDAEGQPAHLRGAVLISAGCLFALGLLLTWSLHPRGPRQTPHRDPAPPPAHDL